MRSSEGLRRGSWRRARRVQRLGSSRNAARAAREELLVKISVPQRAAAAAGDDDVERELSQIAALAQRGAWSQARAELDALTERYRPAPGRGPTAAAGRPSSNRGAQSAPRAARCLPGEGQAARHGRRARGRGCLHAGAGPRCTRAHRPRTMGGAARSRSTRRWSTAPRRHRRLCCELLATWMHRPGSSTGTATCVGWRPRALRHTRRRRRRAAAPRGLAASARLRPRPPRSPARRRRLSLTTSRPVGNQPHTIHRRPPPRRRSRRDPSDCRARPRRCRDGRPDGAREPALLRACDEPVGRGRTARRAGPRASAASAGSPFSFEPKLAPGALVASSTRSSAVWRTGGMGWVYLAPATATSPTGGSSSRGCSTLTTGTRPPRRWPSDASWPRSSTPTSSRSSTSSSTRVWAT